MTCTNQPTILPDGTGYRCPDCGRRVCGAHKTGGTHRLTGNPSPWCHRGRGQGTAHPKIGRCDLHGGASADALTHAEKVIAAHAVATFGLPRDIDPATALLEEVQRTAGHVAWLGRLVADLERDELKQYAHDDNGRAWEKTSVWVRLYQDERAHLVAAARAACAAGVAERQVRLAEERGQLVAQAIRGVLAELGVDLQAPETEQAVRRHLALVTTDAA